MREIVFIILLFFLWGCEHREKQYVIVEKNITISKYKNLLQRYINYWNCMSQKNFQCSYKYELPYQRFLYSYEWYQQFNSGNRKNYKIELLQIIPKKENMIVIKSKFISSDDNVTYQFFDKWYNVDELWFHKMKVSILPFDENKD